MKKLLFALLLLIPGGCAAQEQVFNLQSFGGWVQNVSPDKLNEAPCYSPDLLNVWTDEYNCVTKRKGYVDYLLTATTENQPIKSMYNYTQVDGDKYIVFQSSWSVYYSQGNGNKTLIKSGFDDSYICDYMTAKDFVYISNGYDNMIKSSCSAEGIYTEITVANSTGMVQAPYIEYWRNRAWYAGDTDERSTIWYSEFNIPENIQPLNYIYLNVSDGDKITGMFQSQGRLYVTKTYSTYEIYEKSPGSFDFRLLSNQIGCLYQTTMDEYKGFPIWLSHRGVEAYDGQFNLVSQPIDDYVKGLSQLNPESSMWTQTSAADWGAGTGTNIDTTTYGGSVAISVSTGITSYSTPKTSARHEYIGENYIRWRQKFIPTQTESINGIRTVVEFGVWWVYTAAEIKEIGIYDKDMNAISTTTLFTSGNYNLIDTITLVSGTTYYMAFTLNIQPGQVLDMAYWRNNGTGYFGNVYTNTPFEYYYATTGIWSTFSSPYVWYFELSDISASLNASYTSSINTSAEWGSWGTFTANETKPANSAISYYVRTSTSSDNLSTKAGIAVSNGAVINSAVGPYIQVISSFSRTSSTAVPMLNEFSIEWYATGTNPPVGKTYNDRYYLSVAADGETNDETIVYQKNQDWTKLSLSFSAACLYRNSFYTGSTTEGMIYRQDIGYNDDGSDYDSYWTSKYFDLGNSMQEKIFKALWINAKNSGDWNLDIDWRLDGEDAAWTEKTLSLNSSTGYITGKVGMPWATKGYGIQFKIGNNNADEYYEFRGLRCVYDTKSPR